MKVADIKQAAKWMKEGEKVRRPSFMEGFAYLAVERLKGVSGNQITTTDNNIDLEPLMLTDLLADDWEIAE